MASKTIWGILQLIVQMLKKLNQANNKEIGVMSSLGKFHGIYICKKPSL